MEKIKSIWFDEKRIYLKTTEGRVLSRPLEAYPELKDASMEQRFYHRRRGNLHPMGRFGCRHAHFEFLRDERAEQP